MLPLWHVKDHSHSGGRLHLNAHTPLTQQSWSGLTKLYRHSVEIHQGNELTHNSSRNARPQSSQLAEPLWTDSWLERMELVLMSPFKEKKKKSQAGNDSVNHPALCWHANKKPHSAKLLIAQGGAWEKISHCFFYLL